MESTPLLDCAGRRRSPATTSSFHQALPPRNKGVRYPPDPPTVEEIVAVMRATGDRAEGVRLRGIIVVLWRAGLRISEALALNETDLDADRFGACPAREGRHAPRGRYGPVGMVASRPLVGAQEEAAGRPAVCIVRGPTRGRACTSAGIRAQLHQTAAIAGVRAGLAPHH